MEKIIEFFRNMTPQIRSSLIVIAVLSIVLILVGLFISKLKPSDKTPLILIPFIWIVDVINKFVKENIGSKWKLYAPYFLAITLFIFFANISGIFGLKTPTQYLVVTAALATTVFFCIQITGIRSQGILSYLKGFFDPIPLLFPINLIGEFSMPVSLALRLFGNILSGSVLATIIVGLLGWYVIPIMPFFNAVFDIAFGLIQTLVFISLSVVFTGQKVSDAEKEVLN